MNVKIASLSLLFCVIGCINSSDEPSQKETANMPAEVTEQKQSAYEDWLEIKRLSLKSRQSEAGRNFFAAMEHAAECRRTISLIEQRNGDCRGSSEFDQAFIEWSKASWNLLKATSIFKKIEENQLQEEIFAKYSN